MPAAIFSDRRQPLGACQPGRSAIHSRNRRTLLPTIGFRNLRVPVAKDTAFHWKSGYTWLPAITIHAQHFFSEEGRLDGLGYMVDSTGLLVAAPIIFADHLEGGRPHGMVGSRIVAP